MWNPKSLKITNLFSHEDSYFEFINNQTTTVYGINKTDQNVQSNGSGKTSILDCISVALLGEPLRDISKKEVVRNGEKSGECELVLHNALTNTSLKIKREVNTTKSNNALVWVNDELDCSLKDLSPVETDKYILKLLGISKEDLKNYYLISKDSYQSFFLNGDTAKKEIINRFSKANMIDPVEPLIKADIELLEKQVTDLQNQKSSNEGILSHLNDELNKEKLESSIEKSRQLIINSLEQKKLPIIESKSRLPELISDQQIEINNQQERISRLQEEINSLTKNVDKLGLKELELETSVKFQQQKQDEVESTYGPKFDKIEQKIVEEERKLELDLIENQIQLDSIEFLYVPKFDEIAKQIENCESEIKECNETIKEQDKIIGEIEKNLADEISCPKCDHSFILRDKDYDLDEAKRIAQEASETIGDIKQLIDESCDSIQSLQSTLASLKQDKAKEIDSLVTKKAELRYNSGKNISQFKLEIKSLKDQCAEEARVIVDMKTLLKNELREIQTSITDSIRGKKGKEECLVQEENNLNKLRLVFDSLGTKASFYESQIESIDQSIKEERERKYNDPLKSLEEKISSLADQTQNIQTEIEEWSITKGNLLEWQVRFKQFKSFLANTSISAIEEMTNYFLQRMKTSLSVQIEGYRELSNKKLKEEITVTISRDGLNGESFSKFSGGEKAKCDLAIILAMQKIINIASEGGGLNLVFIDEILESVDELALTGIVKALSELQQTIFIITHVNQNTFDCNKLQVEKVNGISKVLSL